MHGHFTFLGTLLVAVALAPQAGAAPLMLPNGEPDPNCAELRLWLRADSGIQDTQGRSPADPGFNGMVAAWIDRSPRKFDLAAAPGRTPLFVPQQPAAGNRPTVAFAGEQFLTRSNSVLNDGNDLTMALVMRTQRGGHVYSVGKSPGGGIWLAVTYGNDLHSDPAIDELRWTIPTTAAPATRTSEFPTLPSDGRAGSRLAAVICQAAAERPEFHDGLIDMLGDARRSSLWRPQPPLQSDKCSREFCLGGLNLQDGEPLCGEIAEMLVYHRGLAPAERHDLLTYLRRRYGLDMTDGLLPAGTFLLPGEEFEGNWQLLAARMPKEAGRYRHDRYVTTKYVSSPSDLKATIHVPRDGTYHVWVRANNFNAHGSAGVALKTVVQGKELHPTHAGGITREVGWEKAGQVELKAGPAEIVIHAQGGGRKDCDTVLISPTAATLEAVDEICAMAERIRGLGGESRLTAVFENGLRLDGSLLTGWRWMGPSGQVARPDPAALPPRVCLQFDRRTIEPAATADGLLEFQNGDRLRATLCGYVPATSQAGRTAPAQLLVRLPAGFSTDVNKPVPVEVSWLRRIVFEPSWQDVRCPAKTLICRNGRHYPFRALRWGADAISLLTEESLERIPLCDIAELRMPADDAWDTYYRELSLLDPEGAAEILRVETTEGTVLTASTVRSSQFHGDREAIASQRWMQPAWSRAPIAVPWASTRLMWRAPAHVVPLSRILPEQAAQQGALGSSWKWQADRNVAGGNLCSGGLDYLWGFGVHAPNEMIFPLPACARAFRTSVGIDAAVGNTGCAMAKVYVNHTNGAPLYQSRPLVGAGMPVSTGEIALPAAAGAARQLVLATENANEVSGEGDGLDIGNHVDWLEPTLLLDPALLHAEVGKHAAK